MPRRLSVMADASSNACWGVKLQKALANGPYLTSESLVIETVLRGREGCDGIRRVQPSQMREMTVGICSSVHIQLPFCESSLNGPCSALIPYLESVHNVLYEDRDQALLSFL
jgi:hypothetical protein